MFLNVHLWKKKFFKRDIYWSRNGVPDLNLVLANIFNWSLVVFFGIIRGRGCVDVTDTFVGSWIVHWYFVWATMIWFQKAQTLTNTWVNVSWNFKEGLGCSWVLSKENIWTLINHTLPHVFLGSLNNWICSRKLKQNGVESCHAN